MKKVFILGSCVSRDAFALEESKEQYSVVNYIARTSFASSFHSQKTVNVDTSTIPSIFQKRMVENDLFKLTENAIKNTEFDILLVDLIDERFRLFISEDGEIFTISSELKKYCNFKRGGDILHPGDDIFFKYWKSGWNNFINIAKKQGVLDKIVVSKIFWSTTDGENTELTKDDYQKYIEDNNQWLDKLYNYIELSGEVKILKYPQRLFCADLNHKWGYQPFHYTKPLYLYTLSQLNTMMH